MKTLTLLFILCGFIARAQNLGNTKDLAITQNGKCWNGLQVNDTLLAKGLLYFPNGASANYVLTTNAAGIATWTNPTTIAGAWTKSGSNIYPTTLTDNVGIGKVPSTTFDLLSKSGADSITFQINYEVFAIVGYDGGVGTCGFTFDGGGNILIQRQDQDDYISWEGGIIIHSDLEVEFQDTDVEISGEANLNATGNVLVGNILTVSDSVTFNGDIFDLAGIPSDSTSVGSGKVWCDVNGFFRRKF